MPRKPSASNWKNAKINWSTFPPLQELYDEVEALANDAYAGTGTNTQEVVSGMLPIAIEALKVLGVKRQEIEDAVQAVYGPPMPMKQAPEPVPAKVAEPAKKEGLGAIFNR